MKYLSQALWLEQCSHTVEICSFESSTNVEHEVNVILDVFVQNDRWHKSSFRSSTLFQAHPFFWTIWGWITTQVSQINTVPPFVEIMTLNFTSLHLLICENVRCETCFQSNSFYETVGLSPWDACWISNTVSFLKIALLTAGLLLTRHPVMSSNILFSIV